MEAATVQQANVEPDDLTVREFARRKVWAMTDTGTAERWHEDIASEVFIEWKEASVRPDLEIRNWRGWVGSAVRSRLYAERRREQLRRTVHERYARGALRSNRNPEPDEVAQGHEAVVELDDAMRSLRSRKQQQVLAMSYLKGMTSAEIGQLLGMSPESVRGCKKRAIEKLRLAHQDRGFEESLMGIDIGIAATLALLHRPGPKDLLASVTSHLSDGVQSAAASAKQLAGRITGSEVGQASDSTAASAGVGTAATTAAVVGGGKLVGVVCAGVGSVCVAGALVAGVGPGAVINPDKHDARPQVKEPRASSEPVPVSSPVVVPNTDHGSANHESNSGSNGRPEKSSEPESPVDQTVVNAPPVEATPAQAVEAFTPPVTGDPSSSSGGAASPAASSRGQSSASKSSASAGQAAQAFGPLP